MIQGTQKTFENFDQLNFEPFSEDLTSFIETERHFVEGALLVSLNGKFGSGKSTFFEMWQSKLTKESPPRFSPIVLNAWDADFERDALLSIIAAFIRHFEEIDHDTDTENLKELGGKLAKLGLVLGNQIVTKATGMDLLKAKDIAEPKSPSMLAKACFEGYVDRKKAFSDLKNLLQTLVSTAEHPIVVIVDELDRCRPDYAVEYLETIKHIFDLQGLTFVLGVDKDSLKSSVKSLFGESLDFTEYYRKFVHRNVQLPILRNSIDYRNPASHPQMEPFVRSLITEYLKSDKLAESGRYCSAQWDHHHPGQIAELFIALRLSPRQIHEVFRILAHVLYTEKSNSKILWGWQVGTVFLATLSTTEEKLYEQIGQGFVTLDNIAAFFSKHLPLKGEEGHSLWWISIVIIGSLKSEDYSWETLKPVLENLEIYNPNDEHSNIKSKVSKMATAFGLFQENERQPFLQIYEKIERIQRFEGSV